MTSDPEKIVAITAKMFKKQDLSENRSRMRKAIRFNESARKSYTVFPLFLFGSRLACSREQVSCGWNSKAVGLILPVLLLWCEFEYKFISSGFSPTAEEVSL